MVVTVVQVMLGMLHCFECHNQELYASITFATQYTLLPWLKHQEFVGLCQVVARANTMFKSMLLSFLIKILLAGIWFTLLKAVTGLG